MKNDDTNPDDLMRALLHDAVAEVEPRDGLADVRRRTRARRTSVARRWTPLLIGGGAVAATVVAASFVVSGLGDDPEPDHDIPVAGTSTTTVPSTSAAGLYFLSDTPTGPRLFREFQAVTPTTDPEQKILYALQRLTYGPRDPDYHTLWPSDSFSAVRLEDDRIVIELGTEDALQPQGEELGLLGVQQAVYTAEAALGDTLPVTFELDGQATRWVLGARVPAVVERDRSWTTTAPVNITDPTESLAVDGDYLRAEGTVATNVESRVRWALFPAGTPAGAAVDDGVAVPIDITGADARATLGAPGWEVEEIDVADLAEGDYVLVVTVTVAGQTSDRPTEFSDTRTITVR